MGTEGNPKLLRKLAQRVKELREKANLTQENAFNDTGIHFGRIETGKRDFSVSTLKKICVYLQISMTDFFKGIKE
ncbi:helix-turn-helix domain-containing protein [Cytophaga hutchinsonii]|uniref:Regulatory protein possible transcriptional regulator n=1 Tax=Cytophaga hutchinsonii (strain ATCC 33406 / DSM 1761 / CIP 103989 / NBRC 15051 / NCIMB 9469 / D465) TaxID=269798 RepID=A0A6N4SM65_CYTH3|nr:helix-turn-helix transcriptional regulator [Cytophaga hutchinsonii]ABG57340.1 regulatory protein; possible transcriptional regulator [Cytophaga hutchinsonii ATCC 33406]SFX46708.1 DNA-binding transcriptional regulator, XRE-family HTH domain [Cytophaga hutchinsonii ATCC 33406]